MAFWIRSIRKGYCFFLHKFTYCQNSYTVQTSYTGTVLKYSIDSSMVRPYPEVSSTVNRLIGTIRFLSDFNFVKSYNLLQLYRYCTCLSPAAVEAGCGSQRPRAHQPPRAGDPGRLAHMTTCAAGDGCLHPLKALIQPEAFNKHSCQGVSGAPCTVCAALHCPTR